MATVARSCSRAYECCETPPNSSGAIGFRTKLAFFTIRKAGGNDESSAEKRAFVTDVRKGSCCETRNEGPKAVLAGTHLLTNSPRIHERKDGLLTKWCFSRLKYLVTVRLTSRRATTCDKRNSRGKKWSVNKPRNAGRFEDGRQRALLARHPTVRKMTVADRFG